MDMVAHATEAVVMAAWEVSVGMDVLLHPVVMETTSHKREVTATTTTPAAALLLQ